MRAYGSLYNDYKPQKELEETVSPESFIYFSINSDPSLTQIQIFCFITNPNLAQILILTLKKAT